MSLAKRLAALVDDGRVAAEQADEFLARLEEQRQGQQRDGQKLLLFGEPDAVSEKSG